MSFLFKQFSIQQNTTAMKVGTDGVLLGAWSTIKEANILDIGTGTSLIAIMLAQRTKTAIIDAVEIEKSAYEQALENVVNCDWSKRITIHHKAIQDYFPTKKYDVIVSNPPFFIDATKSPNSERNIARHTGDLSFEDLINAMVRLLNSDGIFSLILPITEAQQFISQAKEKDLYLNRECVVKPTPAKQPKRVLMEFSFSTQEVITNELTIETGTRHHYTKEYISLTKDFYLKF